MMLYMKVVGACLFVLGHFVGEPFSRPEEGGPNVRCEANLPLARCEHLRDKFSQLSSHHFFSYVDFLIGLPIVDGEP